MDELKILQKTEQLHEARWWELEPSGKVHCYLCPRHCHIGSGQAGFCFIRINQDGKLYSLGYGAPAALQVDPIEKKPLNHFLPGTRVFSMGTAGCNMGCFFCQNWDISKSRSDQVRSQHVPPEDVPLLALKYGCESIAFTYNEPTIWGEYIIDICKAARNYGLKTVMVTNGYITYDAFHDIYDHIDAANVDLKAFTENFYGKITLTHLQPVLETLAWLKKETPVWFEITNLMIPTLNDDPGKSRWTLACTTSTKEIFTAMARTPIVRSAGNCSSADRGMTCWGITSRTALARSAGLRSPASGRTMRKGSTGQGRTGHLPRRRIRI